MPVVAWILCDIPKADTSEFVSDSIDCWCKCDSMRVFLCLTLKWIISKALTFSESEPYVREQKLCHFFELLIFFFIKRIYKPNCRTVLRQLRHDSHNIEPPLYMLQAFYLIESDVPKKELLKVLNSRAVLSLKNYKNKRSIPRSYFKFLLNSTFNGYFIKGSVAHLSCFMFQMHRFAVNMILTLQQHLKKTRTMTYSALSIIYLIKHLITLQSTCDTQAYLLFHVFPKLQSN